MSAHNKRNVGGGVKRPDGRTYTPGGGNGGRYHGGSNRPSERVEDYWPNYLKGGYFDEQGCLKIEYVARDKVDPLVRAMAESQPKLTTHQARRFFSHCRRIERKLRPDPSAWARVRPDVLFLDEAAADAVGKREKKIPDLFHDFIRQNVAAIKTPADFLDGFLRHFEALIAFGSLHLKER